MRFVIMKVVIYANSTEKESLCSLVETNVAMVFRQKQCIYYDNYDDFLEGLQTHIPHLVIIAKDGASGMEGVIAVKELYPQTNVFWFSDDKAFAPQSYRIGCTYFSVKPITEHSINKAMAYI